MFKNKTIYSVIFFFIFWININNAQQIYIESGFENAYFKDYVNNLGENTLDLNYPKSQQVFIETGIRFDLNFRSDRLWDKKWNFFRFRTKIDAGFSYNNYKINTGFYGGNVSIPLTYNLTYVGLKTGVNFSIINHREYKLYIHGHLSYDMLVSGSSEYKDVVNDIYRDRSLDRTLLRYHRGINAEYLISDITSIYIKYNIADSFKEKNKDTKIKEEYSLHTHAFSFGLLFNIEQLRF
ncbi:hypothetical protein [Polaribacter butkevichii]|uniref:Outer membrane protein beta-barrel domain-containing protein n=1 Tax=Polaribacter butkevichii TaxID=218490 RepID=A0A2P6CEE8_9FLAO|nr:hypothetical protein [Polaribacter butkevichii]PQJ73283.1 hypothetical protein BTO14_08420 [Polaribacter butkevichii]